MKRVVVFSPSRFSLYTIYLVAMLMKRGVKVEAIIIRKMLNKKRFLNEFKRDGKRLLLKAWKKLVLGDYIYRNKKYKTILDLFKNENIKIRDINEFKKKYGTRILYCESLNQKSVLDLLDKINPNLVVFTGGGIIKEQTLNKSGLGILNCHMGILPDYRGMDVIEWAILNDNYDKIGLTVHFMDKGIDTGDIVRTKHVDIRGLKRVSDIRKHFEYFMCLEMLGSVEECLNGTNLRVKQDVKAGRQYYVMNSELLKQVRNKVKNYST